MSDRRLAVRVEVSPGKQELDLKRLPRVIANVAEFLESLAEDSGCGSDLKWIGTSFYGGSLGLRALADPVPPEAYLSFNKNLRTVVQSKHDSNGLSRRTWDSYYKITEPFETDDLVSFGLPPEDRVEHEEDLSRDQMEWFELTRGSIKLNPDIRSKVKTIGEMQGYLYSIVLGRHPPYFVVTDELSTERVKCYYDTSTYGTLVESLKEKQKEKGKGKHDLLVRVSGIITTDMLSEKVERLDVKTIELLVESLTRQDIDRFLGCSPYYLEDDELQDMIRTSRDRG